MSTVLYSGSVINKLIACLGLLLGHQLLRVHNPLCGNEFVMLQQINFVFQTMFIMLNGNNVIICIECKV